MGMWSYRAWSAVTIGLALSVLVSASSPASAFLLAPSSIAEGSDSIQTVVRPSRVIKYGAVERASPSSSSSSPPSSSSSSSTRLQAATLSPGALRDLNRRVADAVDGILLQELQKKDLREVALLCVESFFGESVSSVGVNPVRSLQLASLVDEQLVDLKSRFSMGPRAVMLKAVDEDTGAIVGFVEVSASPGNKYGFGSDKEYKPYLANLAVKGATRRRGIGRMLALACEELAKSWGYNDILLQVEEDNIAARQLYEGLGYTAMFTNRAGRRYDLSGFSIRSVPVTKIYLRKCWAKPSPVSQAWDYIQSSIAALQE